MNTNDIDTMTVVIVLKDGSKAISIIPKHMMNAIAHICGGEFVLVNDIK